MPLLPSPKSYPVQIQSIENPCGDYYLLTFSFPKELTWSPATYALFNLPAHCKTSDNARYLTFASNPNEKELRVLFRLRENSGPFKRYLITLSIGTELSINWIYTRLQLPQGNTPLVLYAAEVGIAAIRPVIQALKDKRPLSVYHLAKGCTAFDSEMRQVAATSPSFHYQTLSSPTDIKESLLAHSDPSATYILAGSPTDVKDMARLLRQAGISRKRLQKEPFQGL